MYKSIAVTTALALLVVASAIGALSSPPEANPATTSSSPVRDDDLVVHEWGTFTSFSGSDGVFLDFRPLAVEHDDLPNFVQDRGSLSNSFQRLLSKRRIWGRVRMETPVTYFYTSRARTVDVRVDFPQGLLTEFYPPVSEIQPPVDEENVFGKGEPIGRSSLTWKNVNLIPEQAFLPAIADVQLRSELTESIVRSLLPHAPNEQHYAAARATDAAIVHVRKPAEMQSSFEKFLFYRGVGKFELPISSAFVDDSVVLKNGSELPVRSAILIQVQGERILAAKMERIEAGQQARFEGLSEVNQEQLAAMVQQSLIAEGLYEKEAASMVATWQQSWFTENGSRVLYVVPEAITNSLLPLQVTPQPRKMLRVLVGRMEIMSPSAEAEMTHAVEQSASARASHNAVASKRQNSDPYPVPDSVRSFGRMAEPALARISKIAKEEHVRKEAALLIAEYQSH